MNVIEKLKFNRPLRAHQQKDLERFWDKPEMALLWEMGAGKTTEAIAWLRAKYVIANDVTKTLIISPVATLYNWQEEFGINSPQRVQDAILVPYMRTRKAKYTGVERAEIIRKTEKKIIIINYQALDHDECFQALKEFGAENLIVDEVHNFKSHKMFTTNASKRKLSRVSKLIAIADKTKHRAIMTGTMILNNYMDAWSQWRILDGGETLGKNFFVYRNEYFRDKNAGMPSDRHFPNWVPKPGIHERLTALMSAKSSRVTKAECLDLPPLVEVRRYVELGAEQEKAYFQMEKDMIAEIKAGTCAAMNALSKTSRMLQIIAGHLPVEHEESGEEYVTKFRDNPRLDTLKELLEELTPNHKVVIWATFAANYPEIRQACKDLNIEFAEITGQTKGDRQEQIVRFRDDEKCRVMLSHPKSGGVGVGFQAASYAIKYSYDHNLGDWLQAAARNHRGGSEIHESITHITLIAKGTIQEPILECLDRKEGDANKILDGIKNALVSSLAR